MAPPTGVAVPCALFRVTAEPFPTTLVWFILDKGIKPEDTPACEFTVVVTGAVDVVDWGLWPPPLDMGFDDGDGALVSTLARLGSAL